MLITRPYSEQIETWPDRGRHILAQHDETSIYVYQAYRPSIADHAVEHQRFGGEFSFTRMSWIKPNFLWMMYRSGWAAKEGQERILAVRLKKTFFDVLLYAAVPSTFDPVRYDSRETWKRAVTSSEVRLQWDPDHDPLGRPLERRAMQLGLRENQLRRYAESELLSIEDITEFVSEQRNNLRFSPEKLTTPKETVYLPGSAQAAMNCGIDVFAVDYGTSE